MSFSELSIAERIREGLKSPLSLTEYAIKNWSVKTVGGRRPFGFVDRDYLRDIYADESNEIVLQKSSQCGVTEYLLARAFFLADCKAATGIFCHPKQHQLNDLSRERIDTAVLFSPHLRSIVDGVNNVGLKRIGRAHLYFRGMQNLDQIISVAVDFAFLDEVDRMIQAHIPVVKKRLGNSTMKHLIYASTPTFPEYGISALFAASDGREWHIKCDLCGLRQCLTMKDNVFGEKNEGPAFFGCQKCKKPIDHTKPGEWVAARPGARVRGYHISKLMSPTTTARELLDSKREDITVHHNFDLGLPHAREGGKIGPEMLDACRGAHERTRIGNGLVLGVDVGKVLNCALGLPIFGKDAKGNPIVTGIKALDFFTVDEFDELDQVMKSGKVFAAVVDALPETRAAKAFANKHSGKVWLAYYTDKPEKEPFALPKDKSKRRQIDIDRTQSLDKSLGRVHERTIDLPVDSDKVPDLYAQLGAPIRVMVDNEKTGNKVARYDEFGKPDHYAHALNYMEAAAWIKMKKTVRRVLSGGRIA